ncbi:MAG TPA: purine-nucleoside phosphorylase [Phaeodactylibacter sp.]|nr:purine-nucleoside phosphorylase [Phaeodactylibacter sp.]
MTYEQLSEARDYVRRETDFEVRTALILGTGLSDLAREIEEEIRLPFGKIPHFPTATAPGHKSELILGRLNGHPVIATAGRLHYYEGHSMQEVVFPLRLMHLLGAETVILSNAAGGVHEKFNAGDLVLITDHINLMPDNPLRGPNDERLGPRFPDMSDAYDPRLQQLARDKAQWMGLTLREGVYVALPGPNLETPAEYEMIHRIGGQLAGMSTVPEVIAARHMGMKVLAFSVVANVCYPLSRIRPVSVEEVIAVAQAAEPKLGALVKSCLSEMA